MTKAEREALTDEEREALLESSIAEVFATTVVGLAAQDQYGTVSFAYDQDAKPERRWRCAIISRDDEEIERFGRSINEAALHVLNVLGGVE